MKSNPIWMCIFAILLLAARGCAAAQAQNSYSETSAKMEFLSWLVGDKQGSGASHAGPQDAQLTIIVHNDNKLGAKVKLGQASGDNSVVWIPIDGPLASNGATVQGEILALSLDSIRRVVTIENQNGVTNEAIMTCIKNSCGCKTRTPVPGTSKTAGSRCDISKKNSIKYIINYYVYGY